MEQTFAFLLLMVAAGFLHTGYRGKISDFDEKHNLTTPEEFKSIKMTNKIAGYLAIIVSIILLLI